MKTPAPRNVHLALRVNGEEQQVSFAPYKTLLEVLREDLNLTGTKHGCELGECGACAVLVEGVPVLSCLALALDFEGRAIETVEGLANGGKLHPLQEAFADLGGAQCGYCTPGILMTAKALLEREPNASRERTPSVFGCRIRPSEGTGAAAEALCGVPRVPVSSTGVNVRGA